MKQETIFALSSGSLPSGVAIVRVSGPGVPAVMSTTIKSLPLPRQAALRAIHKGNGEVIDTGLVVYFPAPHSFTGEECAEFHLHGGRAVVAALFETLSALPDIRMAEPGEFTRRAFDNGKVDLVEAEGLADLLAAETEMQRRLALEQAKGGHSALYQGWAARITHARAMIEAELDFADEDDVPGSIADLIWSDMNRLVAEMDRHLRDHKTGEIIRDGLKVVIFGAPNAGKSSLINRLAQRDVAIVTAVPGTTRDVLSVDLDIDGFAVRLFDTAGIRHTDEVVEQEGIRRARLAAEDADLILHVIDLTASNDESHSIPDTVKSIRVGNKADLIEPPFATKVDVVVSAETGNGIDILRRLVGVFLKENVSGQSLAVPARIRHVELLRKAHAALLDSLHSEGLGLDIRAEHLRVAAQSLGRITGRVDVEDLLSMIFSEFCIGK